MRAAEQFEDSLDICKLVRTIIDFNLLTRLLLTKSQGTLFKRHKRRVVESSGGDASSSHDEYFSEDAWLEGLVGFCAKSDLDKMLIMGLVPSRITKAAKAVNIDPRREPLTHVDMSIRDTANLVQR